MANGILFFLFTKLPYRTLARSFRAAKDFNLNLPKTER